jgi:hypothetical protein
MNKDNIQNCKVIFAAYAETPEQLRHICFLAESIREFAGRFSDAPIWAYAPMTLTDAETLLSKKLVDLDVDIRTSETPEKAQQYYFADKVFAAGDAEKKADGKTDILVWMDEDTIILREPEDFALENEISLGYRPVMHNRSGSLYSEPPDPFWSRIYEVLSVDESTLFPMVTPADRQTIRAYFNAGLLVVRPGCRILRRWGECFTDLYNDPALVDMCDQDITKKIFLHQTALVGAVLNIITKNEMIEFSEYYNYPIFFHQQFESESEFESIDDVVTLRYDIYFRDPDPEWSRKLKGPAHQISWLTDRLGGSPG